MKRVGNLMEQILNKDYLQTCILKAIKHKTNRPEAVEIRNNIEYYTNELYKIFATRSFKPGPFSIWKRTDSINQKQRTIMKPPLFPDQCVHWVLMDILSQKLTGRMDPFCCALLPGRGLDRLTKYVKKAFLRDRNSKNKRKFTKYVLKLDVKKFYESVNHKILKQELERIIKDKYVLEMLFAIIDSYPGDKGLPVGNYTSGWFANLYLGKFDRIVRHKYKIRYYFRYMDDILIFGSSKRALHRLKETIEEDLVNELDLKIKENWQVYDADSRPTDFIGRRFYPDGHVTIRRSTALRIRRRAKKIYKNKVITLADSRAMTSYYGIITSTDSYKFFIKYIKNYVDFAQCIRRQRWESIKGSVIYERHEKKVKELAKKYHAKEEDIRNLLYPTEPKKIIIFE